MVPNGIFINPSLIDTACQPNITTIGIDGKFDDAQAMVKQAFADPELSKINLS